MIKWTKESRMVESQLFRNRFYSKFPETTGFHRTKDPETSVKAAKSIDATKLELRVFDCICASGLTGRTSEEIATEINMELGSITPRMAPLEQKGLISRTETRRAGKSGRGRIVWALNLNAPSISEFHNASMKFMRSNGGTSHE